MSTQKRKKIDRQGNEFEPYQRGKLVDAQSVGVQAEIVLDVMLNDHFDMLGEDVESMDFLDSGVVDDVVALLEVTPQIVDV